MAPRRMNPDLKPGTVIHLSNLSYVLPNSRLARRNRSRLSGGDFSRFSDDALFLEHVGFFSFPYALFVSSRSERNASLRLPESYRPFLSALGIHPTESEFDSNHMMLIRKGSPVHHYYEDRYMTYEQIFDAAQDTSHPHYAPAKQKVTQVLRVLDRADHYEANVLLLNDVDAYVQRFPIRLLYNGNYTSDVIEGNVKDDYSLFIPIYHQYKNIRLLPYDPNVFALKMTPASIAAIDSLTRKQKEHLSLPFGHGMALTWHYSILSRLLMITPKEDGVTEYNGFRYYNLVSPHPFGFDPETPDRILISDHGKYMLSDEFRYTDQHLGLPTFSNSPLSLLTQKKKTRPILSL